MTPLVPKSRPVVDIRSLSHPGLLTIALMLPSDSMVPTSTDLKSVCSKYTVCDITCQACIAKSIRIWHTVCGRQSDGPEVPLRHDDGVPAASGASAEQESSLDATDSNAKQYPRSNWFRVLRWLAKRPWLILLAYPSYVASQLYQLVQREGFVGLLNQSNLSHVTLFDRTVQLVRQYPASGVILVILIILSGFLARWAKQDEDKEQEVLTLSPLVYKYVDARLTYWGVLDSNIHGPPFDDYLLPAPEYFIGRNADYAWVTDRLQRRDTTAIDGMAGIGKTALAATVVKEMRREGQFPDGIAVVLCKGIIEPRDILRHILARFDAQRRKPDNRNAAQLSGRVTQMLSGRRALIVLDDVEPKLNIAQVVQPLRAAGLTVLITARQELPQLAVPSGASRELGLLSFEESLDLFAHENGQNSQYDFGPVELAAAEQIVHSLGRHTLAVKLAGAYAADSGLDLVQVAHELSNTRRVLELPGAEGAEPVKRAFTSSYEVLPEGARKLFIALAAFATEEFGYDAGIALAKGLDISDPEAALELLVHRALLNSFANERIPTDSDSNRVQLHPLLYAFATVLLERQSKRVRSTASGIIASYYAEYLTKNRDAALGADYANIMASLAWAHKQRHKQALVVSICSGVQYYWRDRILTSDALTFLPRGIAAAEKIGRKTQNRQDRLRAARLVQTYGEILLTIGDLARAEEAFKQNLDVRRTLNDRRGEGTAISSLGRIALLRNQTEEAEHLFEQALAIAREGDVHDRRGEGLALSSLGQIAQLREQLDDAERYLNQALLIDRELGDRRSEGIDLGSLGRIALLRNQTEEAEHLFEQALAIAREEDVQNQPGEALILQQLGILARDRGHNEQAEDYFRRCFSLLDLLQDEQSKATVALIFGTFLILYRESREEGCELINLSISIRRRLKLPGEEEARDAAIRLGCSKLALSNA